MENKKQWDNSYRPGHYGGPDNPYEAIKVIRAWSHHKSFNLGNVMKYLQRINSRKPGDTKLALLRKIRTYIDFEIEQTLAELKKVEESDK
jgi:hypothetical protein